MLKTVIGAVLFGSLLGAGVAAAQQRTYSVWGHEFDYPASQSDDPQLVMPKQDFRAQVDDERRYRPKTHELRDFDLR